MTQSLHIPPAEHGRVHVLAVNLPRDDMAARLRSSPVADVARRLAQAPHLHGKGIEVFDIRDLGALTLPDYLIDAHGTDPAAIAPCKARLIALDGFVMLLPSSVFLGKGGQLGLGPDLTHIASLEEPRAKPAAPTLQAASAAAYSGPAGRSVPGAPHRMWRGLSLGALAVFLLLWWVLTAMQP